MCGIVGGFNISRETVQKMNELQGSRGPDNAGIKEIGQVIFGHTRLSIIDKSENSNQPISNGGDMMTYNGEVYTSFSSDTLFLSALLRGVDRLDEFDAVLNSMNGMFAIGYHTPEKIFLFRDRFGIKPLYYTHQKDFFAFASTPAAVALTKTNWDVSQKGLQEYLSLGATTLHSMFEGIIAVPPGHYVTFNCKTNEVKTKRWYYPKFVENAGEVIRQRVEQAIDRIKLTCDWPQIILLSGGIDSTLVASRFIGKSAIHLRSPEQEYAEQVAKKFEIDLHTVDPEDQNAEECLIDYITKSGDPTMAGLIPYITCKEIKKLGYRVAITANGADELFWGYDRMRDSEAQTAAILRKFSFTDEAIGEWSQGRITGVWRDFTERRFSSSQWFEIYTYLTYDLNKTLDFASMCHSVEVRVPYLDHELVEAALSISQEQHTGQFGNKTILKKMLNELGFDWSFIHRPKMGFSLYYLPGDWNSLQDKAMSWYNRSGYEQPINPTGRQGAYHQTTVVGLYLWMKIFNKI